MYATPYDAARDRESVTRVWIECGWITDDKEAKDLLADYLDCNRSFVHRIDGDAEILVSTQEAEFLHSGTPLSHAAVTAVTVGRVARKQGLAGRVLAEVLAEEASRGAVVAGLGIFEQGFYNRMGFGNTPYEHWIALDPATISVSGSMPKPVRLGPEDYPAVHRNLMDRMRHHGSVTLLPEELTRYRLRRPKGSFGLGFETDGTLSHHVWFAKPEGQEGPYAVRWLSYSTWDQLHDLLLLLRSLGDQVHLMRIREPWGVQLQDYVTKPLKHQWVSRGSKFEQLGRAVSYHQLRILDLDAALSAISILGPPIRFNLTLSDPVQRFLGEDSSWVGIGGDYMVTLGRESAAVKGSDPALPTMKAGVGPFTRLWSGSLGAGPLTVRGGLRAPKDLVETLDQRLGWGPPLPDWDY